MISLDWDLKSYRWINCSLCLKLHLEKRQRTEFIAIEYSMFHFIVSNSWLNRKNDRSLETRKHLSSIGWSSAVVIFSNTDESSLLWDEKIANSIFLRGWKRLIWVIQFLQLIVTSKFVLSQRLLSESMIIEEALWGFVLK